MRESMKYLASTLGGPVPPKETVARVTEGKLNNVVDGSETMKKAKEVFVATFTAEGAAIN